MPNQPDQHAALAGVYEQHLASVWRYVRARVPDHADAEDATSEVFARAARGWHRYDASKGSVGAWLAGIAHHVVADWWRGRAMEEPVADPPSPAPNADPNEAVDARIDAARVHEHLGALTDRERDALALRFAAGLDSTEVGAVLGISDAGARMLVYRAVNKLRAVMSDG